MFCLYCANTQNKGRTYSGRLPNANIKSIRFVPAVAQAAASFQRSGRPTYLQVVLGSRTLSDLTRRIRAPRQVGQRART